MGNFWDNHRIPIKPLMCFRANWDKLIQNFPRFALL